MRKFIQIVEGISRSKFRLHPGLDPQKYQIGDSLRDISKWKAYTYTGDDRYPHGEMTEVGYVMISLSDDTIIPISRGDEHHMGMDLLHDMTTGRWYDPVKERFKKGPAINLSPSNFVPIWSGNNYLYHKEEIPRLLIAAKKFLSYGGVDGLLSGGNDYRGKALHLSDFVAQNGNVEVAPGKLAPVGEKIVNSFAELAKHIRETSPADRSQVGKVFTEATALVKLLLPLSYHLDIPHEDFKALPAQLRELRKDDDLEGLEKLLYGFHGLKNNIHVAMKATNDEHKANGDKYNWTYDRMLPIWGDLDLGIAALGRI